MRLATSTRGRLALIGTGLALSAGASALATKQLTGSSASRTTSQSRFTALQVAASAAPRTVPYLGPFARDPKKGRVCGPEVRIMEGALRLTTPPVRKAKAAACVGLATERELKKFQTRHHIPPSGVYGKRTHRALAHAYTPAQIRGLVYTAERRLRLLHDTTIGLVTAHAFAYQGRMIYCEAGSLHQCGRRYVWPAWPDVPRHTDCSGYVAWVYFQAGLFDPNGDTFTGGFTGTLAVRGWTVPPGAPLHIGDLIFNGPRASDTTHVSIYIGHGQSSGHGRFGIQIHAWNYRAVVLVRRYFK